MKRILIGIASAMAASSPLPGGTLLLTNARIHTMDVARPDAEAVLVVGGKIAFVGAAGDAHRRAPADVRVLDLRGLTVVPGLADSHVHLSGIGQRELGFSVEGASSLADLQARLRARAAAQPGRGWLSGRGWIESRWQPAEFPTRRDLDAAVADRPVILVRIDGHAAVANSLALRLGGVTRETPDPVGGAILRDAAGEPTGMLIDNAITLVRRLVPPPTDDEVRAQLLAGAARGMQLGWTQVQIAGSRAGEIDLLRGLFADGRMKLRVYNAALAPGPEADALLAGGFAGDEAGGRLQFRGIKLFVDGALGSRGAALLAPYSDDPGNSGLLLRQPEELRPLLRRALERGIQVWTHAIGDRANRLVLDLYEEAFAAVPPERRAVPEPRWRVEHAQVLAPEDIPRFARLGVVASMQPSHAISDLFFAPARLGAGRLGGAYAWRSLLDAGAMIAGGSDAPIERGEPMIEFYAAAVRQSLDGRSDANWRREQRVSRLEALRMFTLAPAYAAFQEHERGSIAVGKQADFTVLSADIFSIPEAEILGTRCVMTIIGGEVVWQEPQSARDAEADRGAGVARTETKRQGTEAPALCHASVAPISRP